MVAFKPNVYYLQTLSSQVANENINLMLFGMAGEIAKSTPTRESHLRSHP